MLFSIVLFFTNAVYADSSTPGAPSGLSAVATSDSQANLTWTAPANIGSHSITGYKIEYRIGTGQYNTLIEKTPTNATSYTHLGVKLGQFYIYHVQTINSDKLISDPSSEFKLQMPSTSSPPSAPTGLTAFAVSPTQINLSWNTPSNNGFQILGYKIDFKKGSGSYSTLVANTNNVTTSYLHTQLTTGTTYAYKVYAINSIGTSNASPEASATPTSSSSFSLPSSPTGLTATAVSISQINLSWTAPANTGGNPIIGYKIEYKKGSDAYSTLVANTGNIATSYSHTQLTSGQTYVYKVSAITSVGTSNPSTEASAIPMASSSTTKTAPGSPLNLVVTTVSGSQLNLSWSSPASNGGSPVTGYKIESKKGSDPYTVLVPNTGSAMTTYSHVGVSSSNVYYYRVSAITSVGVGNPSAEASGTPKDSDKPRLTATAISPTSIYLSWIAPSQTYHQTISGFKVEEKQVDSYTLIKDNTGPVDGFAVTGLSTGKSHTYVVSAVFSVGASPRSNEASATPTTTSVTPFGFSITPKPIMTGTTANDPTAILKEQQDAMQSKIQEAKDSMSKLAGKTDSEKAIAAREAAQKANELANKNATETIKKRIAESQARKKMPMSTPVPTTSAKLADTAKSKPKTIEEARRLAEESKQKALSQQDSLDPLKQKRDLKEKAKKQMESQKSAYWEKARKALEAMKNQPSK